MGAFTAIQHQAKFDANGKTSITGVSGTAGTSDVNGTAEIVRVGVDPSTGAMFTKSVGGGGADGGTFQSGTTSGNLIQAVVQGTPTTVADQSIGAVRMSSNRALKIDQDTLLAGEDLTNNVLGILLKPVASSTYAPSEFTSFGAAAGTGSLVKASAGNVLSFDVTSTDTAIRYFQIFNQGSAPVLGQTAVASYPLGSVTAGGVFRLQVGVDDLAPSRYNSSGIAVAISSTNGTLGTASVTAANHTIHLKYI